MTSVQVSFRVSIVIVTVRGFEDRCLLRPCNHVSGRNEWEMLQCESLDDLVSTDEDSDEYGQHGGRSLDCGKS